jgi:hypothetical protein
MSDLKIDRRTRKEIADRTRELVKQYTTWTPGDGAGGTIIELFGGMMEKLIDRLNRAPEKHFLAFLDMIGVEPLPPAPARVPLTFNIAAGTRGSAKVPAYTNVAASDALTGEDILYQTEQDLYLTPALLAGVFVRDPLNDQYADYTDSAFGTTPTAFHVFAGTTPITHSFFLARDDFFGLPDSKTVVLIFESADASTLDALPFEWLYWDGAIWTPLPATSYQISHFQWQISFENCPVPKPLAINGITARWICARLNAALPPAADSEIALFDETVLELTGPFAPFDQNLPGVPFLMRVEPASPETRKLELHFSFDAAGTPSPAAILIWEFWDGQTWVMLGRSRADGPDNTSFNFDDTTNAFQNEGVVRFDLPPAWSTDHDGWLRVRLSKGDFGRNWPAIKKLTGIYKWQLTDLPKIDQITVEVGTGDNNIKPGPSYTNSEPLDLNADFYPFGPEPAYNRAFYLNCADAFSKPNARVFIDITLTNPIDVPRTDPPATVGPSTGIEIAWEVWNGDGWILLGNSAKDYAKVDPTPFDFSDMTFAFTKNGRVSFVLPWDREQNTLGNGVSGYWVRARIIKGNYGSAAHIATDDSGNQVLVPASFQPPVVKAIKIHYQYVTFGPVDTCLTYNDFIYQRYSATPDDPPFAPLTRSADTTPALYLAFDSPFRDQPPFVDAAPVTLYVRPDTNFTRDEMDAIAMTAPDSAPPRLLWEYSSPQGWTSFTALDSTHNLTRRGLVQFQGMSDFTVREEFGVRHGWLRVRKLEGDYPVAPRLTALRLNTIWGAHCTFAQQQELGVSNGEALQTMQISIQTPIMADERLEVKTDKGWEIWTCVPDFSAVEAQDRVYAIDRLHGVVYFGNGIYGMIPPKNAPLRISYRAGNGTRGNVAAGGINQMKTTLPNVDSVINHEPAEGDTPFESLERVKIRGPRTLRHNHRAVTAMDYEDLAFEITGVQRVMAITPDLANADAPGQVGLIIVPESTDTQPIPSLGLIEEVRDHILSLCPPTVDVWISGPDWLQVSITAEIWPISLDLSPQIKLNVTTRLAAFLHPITGGFGGTGWQFGRQPHESDFYALIQSIPGVDHIESLSITTAGEVRPGRFLIYSGEHTIRLKA